MLGIEGRLPRYRGEPDRGSAITRVAGLHTAVTARLTAVAIMAGVALLVTPDGLRIIARAAAGAGGWAAYHALRERRGGVMGNQPFEWPRLSVGCGVRGHDSGRWADRARFGGVHDPGARRVHAHPLTLPEPFRAPLTARMTKRRQAPLVKGFSFELTAVRRACGTCTPRYWMRPSLDSHFIQRVPTIIVFWASADPCSRKNLSRNGYVGNVFFLMLRFAASSSPARLPMDL